MFSVNRDGTLRFSVATKQSRALCDRTAVAGPRAIVLGVNMSAIANVTSQNLAAVYDRVVNEARRSFGHLLADEEVVSAAREAVDELLVRQHARVMLFIPVLPMRRLRESIADSDGFR